MKITLSLIILTLSACNMAVPNDCTLQLPHQSGCDGGGGFEAPASEPEAPGPEETE